MWNLGERLSVDGTSENACGITLMMRLDYKLRISNALRPTIQPEQQKLKHASDSLPKPNN